jgi:hypothetical protein
MHQWGQEDVDWQGINDAAYYIAHWLKTWVRLSVVDYKEKFGTVRVYCTFGLQGIYFIWRPNYCWVPKWWPYSFDLWLTHHTPLFRWLNKIVVPIQMKAYAWRYKKAVQKWPHLYKEIVSMADYGELFEGVVPGYKHSNFWKQV